MLISCKDLSLDRYTACAVWIGAVDAPGPLARVRAQWVAVDARQSDRPVNLPWQRLIEKTRLEGCTEE